jgi:hypothetical protein
MKKLLLLALLALPASAHAEWIEIDTGDSIREVYVYVDSAAIRRNGEVFNFWTMWDFTSAQSDMPGAPYRSAKSQQEINCAARQSRTLTLSFHSEQMALGDVVFTYTFDGSAKEFDRAWKPIAPNTFFSEIFKAICASAK